MRSLFPSTAGLAVAVSSSLLFAQDAARPPIKVRETPRANVQVEVQQRETRKIPDNAPSDSPHRDDAMSTRASDLMGTELILENGESLGKVNDLIIDNRNGQVAYVIVETEQDYRPIPWKTLALHQGQTAEDRYFVIGMEREKFMEGPAIQRTEWQTYSAPQWQTIQPRVGQFYADVRVVNPANVRRDLNQVDRKLDQGERKADRQIDRAERKAGRKID